MGKEELFSKLKFKNYNNELEKILEKKDFSVDVKNLLLSMLYKIEVSYEDYSTAKAEEKAKSEIIEEILDIIKNQCYDIKIVKLGSDEASVLVNLNAESIANKQTGEIISYPNEKSILYALYILKNRRESECIVDKKIYEPVSKLLEIGSSLNIKEIITDFDGWAWNKEIQKEEDLTYNCIYQNISLLGIKKFSKEEIEKVTNDKIGIKLYKDVCKIAVLMNSSYELEESLNVYRSLLKKQLKEMDDKVAYLKKYADSKKKLEIKIKEIDKKLTDADLLIEEYEKRNARLTKANKIFSVSDLSDIIQQEREKYILEIAEINGKMDPKKYASTKGKLEEILEIVDVINTETSINELMLESQKDFICALENNLKKAKLKKEIINLIYILRYYKTIYIEKDKQIKDITEISDKINKLQKNILTQACNLGTLTIISNDVAQNYKAISEIMNTKIINLEKIQLEIIEQDGKSVVNIYDETILEKSINISKIEELNIKQGKKFKLFIGGKK